MTDDIAITNRELRRFNRKNLLMRLYIFFWCVLVFWGVYALNITTLNNEDNGTRSLIPNWQVSALIVLSAMVLLLIMHWLFNIKIICVRRRALSLGLLNDMQLNIEISNLSDAELVTLFEALLKMKPSSIRVCSCLSDELSKRCLVSENDFNKSSIVSNGTVKNRGLFHRVFLGQSFFIFYREFETYGYLVRFDRIQYARRLSKHTIGIWGIAANIIEIKLEDNRYPEPLEILPRYIAGWEDALISSGYSFTETP